MKMFVASNQKQLLQDHVKSYTIVTYMNDHIYDTHNIYDESHFKFHYHLQILKKL